MDYGRQSYIERKCKIKIASSLINPGEGQSYFLSVNSASHLGRLVFGGITY